MLLSGFCLVAVLATIAQRELSVSAEIEAANEKEPKKEAPAPLSQGLRRLRLAGSSSSIDFRHARALSMSRNFMRTPYVEPPSPVPEHPHF